MKINAILNFYFYQKKLKTSLKKLFSAKFAYIIKILLLLKLFLLRPIS
jgi:hypothetical protein